MIRRNFEVKRLGAAIAAALLGPWTTTVSAQPSDTELLQIDEVVVTARRRAESLQDVPLAVQAFSAEDMKKLVIIDPQEIMDRVPGMTAREGLDKEIFIRGIGSDIQGAAVERPVGIFLDGIYMSRTSGSNIALFDLERVEVLKGPQSLRYGKNVVGGVINYVTRKPSQESDGYVRLTYGDYERLDLEGGFRGPLSDRVSYSISGMSNDRDGYANNTRGGDAEDLDRSAVRGQLLFDITDDASLLLSADYSKNDSSGVWIDPAVTGDSTAVTFNRFFAPPIESLPGFVLPSRNAPFAEDDPREGPRNLEGERYAELMGGSATFNWSLSDSFEVQAITAYRETETRAISDSCGMLWDFPMSAQGELTIPDASSAITDSLDTYLSNVPDCWFHTNRSDAADQISQELRLTWETGKITWSAGAYYLKEDIERLERIAFSFPDFNVITDWSFALAFGGAPSGSVDTEGVSNALTRSESVNMSAFGEINIALTEKLDLNAGIRYARDEKDFEVTRAGASFDEPICPVDDAGMLPVGCSAPGQFTTGDSESWSEWLPSIALTYSATDDQNYYLRLERGYKPGGWTGEGSGTPTSALISFDAEFATAYELGGKLFLLDRRMLLNFALHFTEYEDLQTQQFVAADPTRPPDNFVVNASNGTEAYGVEVDFQYAMTRWLSVFANYAYTDCEFSGSVIVDDDGTDIDGNTCRRTPKHGINFGADSSLAIGNELEARLGFDVQWRDDYFWDNENSPDQLVDAQYAVNLRAGLAPANDQWNAMLWAKNVTNELNTSNLFTLFGTTYLNYSAPRAYGVTFNYNF